MNTITPISAFDSNYIWMLPHRFTTDEVWVVDPGDAEVVFDALSKHNKRLGGILVTHRHADHIGGVEALVAHFKVPVIGPHSSAIPCVTHVVADQQELEIAGYNAKVIAVPGHTNEHIAFYLPAISALFCGDALFAGGCGRVFDGNPRQHFASLQTLAQLPDNTLVYCAHEYTHSNLEFAIRIEPDSHPLKERLRNTMAAREKNIPTIPSRLDLEKATNPFLRADQPSVQAFARDVLAVKNPTPVDVFIAIRQLKDHS